MSKPRTFTKRIYLDAAFNRSTTDKSDHWAGTTVKAYRVLYTNNEAFELDIVADPDNGSIKGIPMGYQRIHNYQTPAKNAVFENSVAQPGVYVDVLISVEDELVWTQERVTENEVIINEGSSHSSSKITVPTATAIQIFAADQDRKMGVLQNKSLNPIYVGNDSASELQHADWKDICEEVAPNASFVWKNKGSLSARADAGAAVVSVRTET
jgi:hypothetical protein